MKNHSVDVPVMGVQTKVTLNSIIDSNKYSVDQQYAPAVIIDCLYAIKLLAMEIKSLKEEMKQLKEIIIGDEK